LVHLASLGLDARLEGLWQSSARPGLRAGRVIQEQKGVYRVLVASDPTAAVVPVWAVLAGRLAHASAAPQELPAVGDFVLVEGDARGDAGRCRIAELLPRRTRLVRKAVGASSDEQVIAANVDTVFIVTSLNDDLSERRIERYLTAVWDGGALPVVLLSKADLEGDRAAQVARVERVAIGAPVHCVSVATGEGLDTVRGYVKAGTTATLVGSSGVGKSTLINALVGDALQAVQEIRETDAKGRHTTTARTLVTLDGGGMIIDTPGMREFMPSDEGGGLGAVFGDVEDLATACRFTDCRHESEPGCAVQAAIADGRIDVGRLASFRKLEREQAFLARKQDASAASAQKKKWKTIHKEMRHHPKKSR
jgi:ribosome biogenesis GTPase